MKRLEGDTYRTPQERRLTLLARVSPWPELAFYVPVLRVVFRASLQAVAGRFDDERWGEASRGIVRAMEGVGMKLTVEGLDHVRSAEGPVVYVGNHMSTLETFVLPSLLRPEGPVTYVVKDSLLRYPVFGPIMRSRDPVSVGRKNPREDLAAVLGGGQERLARGVSMVVFPQTTRTSGFDRAHFNSIGAKLAARAGVPVIPVALRTDAWGTGRRLKDFGPVDPSLPVHIRFGAPLPPAGKGAEVHEATVAFIETNLRAWGVSVAG